MSQRTRVLLLAVVVTVVVGLTAGFAVLRATGSKDSAGAAQATDELPTGPRVVFRNTSLDGDNGKVAVVPLDSPDGPRAFVGPVCDRVDADEHHLACLRSDSGLAATYAMDLYTDGKRVDSWPVAGIPSRTRLSPAGDRYASTVFVSGHSYMQTGFSTATVIRDDSGEEVNLEDFDATVDGKPLTRRDRNFWGVTFVDDDVFYATAASGGKTWLMKGSVEDRTLRSIRGNAECPSVSPDHTRVAYKKRGPDDTWAVAVLDLASGEEQVIERTRGLDDQVAWLDDDTILYGLPRSGVTGVTDIWRVGATEDSTPELYIQSASSPAVVG